MRHLLPHIIDFWREGRPFAVFSFPRTPMKLIAQNDDNIHTWNTKPDGEGFIIKGFVDSKETPPLIIRPHITIINEATSVIPSFSRSTPYEARRASPPPPPATTEDTYESMIEQGLRYLKSGVLSKIVLGRIIVARFSPADMTNFLKRLFTAYPETLTYFWYHPGIGGWCGATPECFARMRGTEWNSSPLAGTLPHDSAQAWRDRHHREHDAVRQFIEDALPTLGFSHIETQSEECVSGKVKHLMSKITATAGTEYSFANMLKRLHPTPAICGAPSSKAREAILLIEPFPREYYGGLVGYYENERNYNLHINLRCLHIFDTAAAAAYVGSGILPDSIASEEWQETELKSHTMLDII